MKFKFYVPVLLGALVFAIPQTGFSQTKKKKKTVATRSNITLTKVTPAEIEDGKALLSKSDCLACHKMDAKLVGPAYIDVAKKYAATEANYNYLAHKIVTGGSGAWGQVAMSAHPLLSAVEAKKIAKYVLSIK